MKKTEKGLPKKLVKELNKKLDKSISKQFKEKLLNTLTTKIDEKIGKELEGVIDQYQIEVNSFEESVLFETNQWYRKTSRKLIVVLGSIAVLVILLTVFFGVRITRKTEKQIWETHASQVMQMEKYVQKLNFILDSVSQRQEFIINNQVAQKLNSKSFDEYVKTLITDQTNKTALPIIQSTTKQLIGKSEKQFDSFLDSLEIRTSERILSNNLIPVFMY